MKICNKFTGEHPCQSVVSIRLQINYIEITLRHGCSPVSLLYIFRTLFYKNTSGQKKQHRVGSRNLLLFFWIKTFLRHAKVFFPFLRDFRLSFFDQFESKISGYFFPRSLWKILRWLIKWSCKIFCFCILLKSEEKYAPMHNSYKNFLKNIRQVLLSFFQHQTLCKNNSAHQNIHLAWLNFQLNYGFWVLYIFFYL